METLLIIFGVVALCVGLFVWGWKYEKKWLKINHDKTVQQAQKWLEREHQKKMSKVVIKTKSGFTFTTTEIAPHYEIHSNWSLEADHEKRYEFSRHSSKQNAKKAIEDWIDNDRFYDVETCTYIPMCEIESFKVVVEE
jgi:FtsZ-interacting cell division protein ZipA